MRSVFKRFGSAPVSFISLVVLCCYHMKLLVLRPCLSQYVELYCSCLQVAVIFLCLVSSTFGICWTRTMKPYTVDVPKKIYMYHMHHVDAAGHVQKSTWDLAAIDSAPVSWALPADLASLPREEWEKPNQLVLYPVNNFMQVHALPLCHRWLLPDMQCHENCSCAAPSCMHDIESRSSGDFYATWWFYRG